MRAACNLAELWSSSPIGCARTICRGDGKPVTMQPTHTTFRQRPNVRPVTGKPLLDCSKSLRKRLVICD